MSTTWINPFEGLWNLIVYGIFGNLIIYYPITLTIVFLIYFFVLKKRKWKITIFITNTIWGLFWYIYAHYYPDWGAILYVFYGIFTLLLSFIYGIILLATRKKTTRKNEVSHY